MGLKNSDDVGSYFDLRAEVYKGGTLVGSGQSGVSGGSSGFNNAKLSSINLALPAALDIASGDTLRIKLSARITCSRGIHASGTARLWFNDALANSGFGATIGGSNTSYFLLNGSALGTAPGRGPKGTVDVFLNSSVGCPTRLCTPFGTWSISVP